ncbi:MAG: Rpn family recombination-promoting nuclease/putative transposase [Gammaproteobacteria bacterium]|nr:Rpn family recombination-promoting nuclease/putative transposase [Gammaproteobacteria bacterium]MBU1656186.1 Rpn family recombination-promoting nuclease/putative transposase [Gammaproteobacteria bacterium]MBU1960446.1 Rpn family recombination-promoting nuclease/putative transposase [Gammaproteobacteria bacterium]
MADHPPHDNAYKHLFSHPKAVEDLLRGFVHEDWVGQLDFGSLEKMSGSYVSDDLRDREDDIVWRLRLQGSDDGDWLYVYLLLEFQSSVDPQMAVRILTYLGLLYQDLIKGGQVAKADKLPAVFPLVLYHGERPWTAALDIAELIETGPASLAAYRPRLRYFLLDEGRVPESDLDQPDNSIASLVQIERSASPQAIAQAVAQLTEKLQSPEYRSLRRAFTVWIKRLILRRFAPAGELPELQDLSEVNSMIAERVESWTQQWLRQGIQQGRQEGRQQGRQEGKREEASRMLLRLLVRRFGPLDAATLARLEQAGLEQLEHWTDNILDAMSLEAVFKD